MERHVVAMPAEPKAPESLLLRLAWVVAVMATFALLTRVVLGDPPSFLVLVVFGAIVGLGLELEAARSETAPEP